MSEYKSDDGAEHVIERRCKINVEAPYLLKKVSLILCLLAYIALVSVSLYPSRCVKLLYVKRVFLHNV